MAFLKLSIVFVLFVSIACCDSYPDRDIAGQQLANTAGQASDCCGICLGVSGCYAYVWDNFLGGTCYLKNATGPVGFKAGSIVGLPCEDLKKPGIF
uniref:Apple domain-containing protein n=1 Tax=Panagrolaimus davidi TaxID=227884 RepID=A0A914Q9Z6_9BILA